MSAAPLRLADLRTLAEQGVFRAPMARGAPTGWSRETLAGRLTELSGHGASAALTFGLLAVLDVQREGETAAWICAHNPFFPPDAEALGIDLAALPVVRVPDAAAAARAADALLRSGAFGLVTLDLGADDRVPQPLLARVTQLAHKHGTALLALTEKPPRARSLGSLVSLHVRATRRRAGDDRFVCELEAVKDKLRGPGWRHTEVCHGPPGLR